MKVENDPMGNAIMDFYKTAEPDFINVFSGISEPDIIPVEYLFRKFDEMPEIEQKALELSQGRVMEIGAGAGSHSYWLQMKGFDVMALDISGLSVEVMRKRGVKNTIKADFFSFDTAKKYDTLLFLMNGIGIAGTLDRLPVFLNQCKKLLAPGGKVLLDSSDISYMFEDGDEIPENYYGEVSYLMEYKGVKSEPFKWLFVDFFTLTKYVEESGGKCRKIIDGKHFDYLAEIVW